MIGLRTRRTKRILAIRLQSDLRRSTPNRHEFDLASAKLLLTTSLLLANFNSSTSWW
jgi:hypothetical protein